MDRLRRPAGLTHNQECHTSVNNDRINTPRPGRFLYIGFINTPALHGTGILSVITQQYVYRARVSINLGNKKALKVQQRVVIIPTSEECTIIMPCVVSIHGTCQYL